MDLQKQIRELTAVRGLSAAETPIAEVLLEKLKKLGLRAKIDAFGNVHGMRRCEYSDAKTLLLEAHMDQIGLMVSGIDEAGAVQFSNLGGVDERILPGMEVEILSSPPISGVIGALMPIGEKEEEKKNPKLTQYRIHTGLTAQEAKNRIRVGDWIQISGKTTELLHGRMSGSAMDNRAGVAAILACLEELQSCPLPYHVSVLFSTQEELGLHGAYTGVPRMKADAAIAVDVTHGETPDTQGEPGVFPLGCGAVICRGPNLHYEYTKQLIQLAKQSGVSHEIEVASGGSGTTAWAIQTINGGIPVMLISIPLRYMHTNVETLQISDVEAVAKLLSAAAKGGVVLA